MLLASRKIKDAESITKLLKPVVLPESSRFLYISTFSSRFELILLLFRQHNRQTSGTVRAND